MRPPASFAAAMHTASLRVATPVRTALLPSASLARASPFVLPPFPFGGAVQTRNSAKRGGGTTKNNRNSAGRRLGVKRPGSNFVKPGDIIYRQRGTSWHPGEHVGIGRDHTLYAKVPGFVRFYKPNYEQKQVKPAIAPLGTLPLRLPQRETVYAHSPETVRPHPSSGRKSRKFVGIVLARDGVLPRKPGLPRARLFNKTDLNAVEKEKQMRRRGIEPLALDASLA
ncbi:54S ribosomal protein L2 mitochondrial [Malassezia vespertilionis]|uniref:Large ribosomal subunit protein bL27m n=1 Tax=Malassezia vespertilionis TaxID=2020962 RepID=A0A2N1JBK8_9BASI|nr:54S ribosomal protein L2 mitochondrial [Malassezia vespertilionis]PKI83941.1 Rpl27p [Malassezia vespertilionis]WFD07042.1 54S ribosomal protein L2 mitochondrial [Malassezia vespertilionis]